MLKRVKPFGFLVVLLVLSSGMAQADLVAHWSLDDGAGNTVADSSGNGYGGTFEGNPEWVEGLYGQALNFAGLPDRVVVPYSPGLNPEGAFTVIAWSNVGLGSSGWRSPITSRDDGPQRGYIIYAGDNGNWQFWIGTGSGWSNAAGPPVQMGEWTHTAGVYEPGQQTLYINGVQVGQASGTISLNTQQVLTIGAGRTDVPAGDYFFVGMVDDVALFDNALTEQEIQTAMQGLGAAELASSPIPDDGLPDTPRDTSLNWTPGKYAANHNVYLGTVWEDVNNASVDNPLAALISQDQSATTFDPGRLEFSQTYFWRVDEVNGAPDFTVFEGGVWSFTVEPIAYPITAITATASSSFGASGPEKTIDGSGLVDGLHGVSASDMWISGGIPATIEYAFDRAYKLHELWIWNSNQPIEAFVG
ncbi:MAG: LamG domain-containing protein, partial [Planctomycetes bacterium]|nr:LamG domain-containing protein [Planctomycetota bacterium]